jgi:CheY-like chemotaxis protein
MKDSILYVDDDIELINILSLLLKSHFKNVYTAKDGEEGLEEYKKHLPDIVLSDYSMPNMNGIEMAKNIKKINKNQKIVLISAYNSAKIRSEAEEAGIDSFLNKPIDFGDLLKVLEGL